MSHPMVRLCLSQYGYLRSTGRAPRRPQIQHGRAAVDLGERFTYTVDTHKGNRINTLGLLRKIRDCRRRTPDRRPGHDRCDEGFSQRTAAKKVPSDHAATGDHTRDQVEPLVSEI
jgi:hypothetical protein